MSKRISRRHGCPLTLARVTAAVSAELGVRAHAFRAGGEHVAQPAVPTAAAIDEEWRG